MSGERDSTDFTDSPKHAAKPPVRQFGTLFWLRQNLFSGIFNSLVSVAAILLFVWFSWLFFEWAILHGVWQAHSYESCLAIIAEFHGKDASGACWAVFNGRVTYFLIGSYPPELYWRPAVALVLVGVALVPVLVRSLPRKLLWVSAICPIFVYWFVLGGLGLAPIRSWDVGGALLAVTITVGAVPLAIVVGIALAFGRQFLALPVRIFCASIIEFSKGVPLLVLLYVSFTIAAYFAPPGALIDYIYRVLITIAVYAGARVADAVGDGLAAVPEGQWQTARTLDLGRWSTVSQIVMPQVIRSAMPRIVLVSGGVFRDTTIISGVGFLGPLQLIGVTRATTEWNGIIWEFYLAIGLFYWIISFATIWYSGRIERRLEAERPKPSKCWARGQSKATLLHDS